MNIYVGNLSYKARENDLRQAFEAYGQVASVKIITDRATKRSKGFGFVEMPNDDEARHAIEKLHGQDLMGRNLNVNESLSKPQQPREGQQSE
ncbi:MAG: RNA-binding protein [Bacteroidia bacterium]|jgi:RNA recognition motif-containing protein|nr:RNA-binding protein [Bacteroidia bacterium]